MKLCKDCKYYDVKRYQVNPDSHTCSKFVETHIDLVSGEKRAIGKMDAYNIRYNEEICGKEGKLWEPK